MKLSQILEDGHWAVVPDYPNSIVKGKDKGKSKKEQLSLFVDPKQRDEYIKKMKMDVQNENSINGLIEKHHSHINFMAEWGVKNGVSIEMLLEATASPVSDLWGQHHGGQQQSTIEKDIDREPNPDKKREEKTAIEDWPIEKKYVAVSDWVTNLFERLADKGKGALGKKPKWMVQDGDMHKLLGAVIQELENEMKAISAKANAHLQKVGH